MGDASAPGDPFPLAAEFPPATAAQWRALAAGVLARSGRPDGADPLAELSSSTYEGIRVLPLYTRAEAPAVGTGRPGCAPHVRGATADGATVSGWDVRVRHDDADPKTLRDKALTDLERGATSLWLAVGAGALAPADLAAALDGVYLGVAPVVLDAGPATLDAARALLALVADRSDPAAVRGSLGADPVGLRARTGADADLGLLGTLAGLGRGCPALCLATVDAIVYAEAGGSDADEIAVATSVGVAYLRALADAGLSLDRALDAIEFRFSVGADQFLSIAKLRAARRVWSRVAELSGAEPTRRGQRQHAVTSAAMMTRRDPWVNMLRTTIACFAAAVGGAEAITVRPFDSAIGRSDDFARRVARNTQAILHDESSLGRVVDAAGGSWYVETVTDQLADRAWDSFTAIERTGGASAALEDGMIARLLEASRTQRADDIAHRRAPITGVSEFALPDEAPVRREPSAPAPAGGPLRPIRYAAEFERLRDRAEAAVPRPAVFLAALGPAGAYSGRVGFATNLFQAGGLRVVVGTGEPDDLVSAFAASGTTVACLCSSDRVYSELAASEAAALKAAGARYVWIAGSPGKDEESDRAAGIDGYLCAGCDALDALRTTLDLLGVTA